MIIGITGTLGAGKGTVAEYLVKKHGFNYLSVRNFLAAEVVRRGLLVSRDTISRVANELRAEHGPSWAIEQLLAEAVSQTKVFHQKNIVIESVRTVGEVQVLKSKRALLWAIDADINARYTRTVKRAGEKDALALKEIMVAETKELIPLDPNEAILTAVMRLADASIVNNGTPEELDAKIELALQNAGNKTQ